MVYPGTTNLHLYLSNYELYLIFIVILLGLPIGSVSGLLITNKLILKLPLRCDYKKELFSLVSCFIGMILMLFLRFLVETFRCQIFIFLRGDIYLLFIIIMAGFSSVIGYNINKFFK